MVVRTEPICLARTGPEQVRTRHQSQDCKGAAPRTGLFVEIGITVWNEKISGPNAINWSLDQLFELLAIYRAHERLVYLRPAQSLVRGSFLRTFLPFICKSLLVICSTLGKPSRHAETPCRNTARISSIVGEERLRRCFGIPAFKR